MWFLQWTTIFNEQILIFFKSILFWQLTLVSSLVVGFITGSESTARENERERKRYLNIKYFPELYIYLVDLYLALPEVNFQLGGMQDSAIASQMRFLKKREVLEESNMVKINNYFKKWIFFCYQGFKTRGEWLDSCWKCLK